jgi:very-short-patch-repair endonuclease
MLNIDKSSIDALVERPRCSCLFSDSLEETRFSLQSAVEAVDDLRLVCLDLQRIPLVANLTDTLLHGMAECLLMLWPDWADAAGDGPAAVPVSTASTDVVKRVPRVATRVDPHWRERAARCCHDQQVPILPDLTSAKQVRQIRLALADCRLVIALCVYEEDPAESRLLGFAKVTAWLSREAHASVIAVLPQSLRWRAELDAINSLVLCDHAEHSPARPVAASPSGPRSSVAKAINDRKHVLCPLTGRPHPASQGEQMLAAQLARDDQLRGLFQFNQPLSTKFASRFVVDLLWEEGRVIVEVDGYRWHSHEAAFNTDRERDYELMVSGYLVLRLPHSFVVDDPELACERVRRMVQLRQAQSDVPGEPE